MAQIGYKDVQDPRILFSIKSEVVVHSHPNNNILFWPYFQWNRSLLVKERSNVNVAKTVHIEKLWRIDVYQDEPSHNSIYINCGWNYRAFIAQLEMLQPHLIKQWIPSSIMPPLGRILLYVILKSNWNWCVY